MYAQHAPVAPVASPSGPGPLRRIAGVFGRLVATVLIVAAGAAGWFAVDRTVFAEPEAWGALPPVGDGLPVDHVAPALPRAFLLAYGAPGRPVGEEQWFDLDRGLIVQSWDGGRGESGLDRGFFRAAGATDWVEHTPDDLRDHRRFVSANSGPFAVTDVLPPMLLPHVTVDSDEVLVGDDGAELRRYLVSIDVDGFRAANPVGFERWKLVQLDPSVPQQVWTVDVDRDGLVRALDQGTVQRTWTPLDAPIPLESPLRDLVATTVPPAPAPGAPATAPPATTVPADPGP